MRNVPFSRSDVTGKFAGSVLVGQRIALSATVEAPPALILPGRSWSVPGPIFRDYIATASEGVLHTDVDLASASTTFYWSDATPAGTERNVSVSVPLLTGVSISRSTKFKVFEPESEFSVAVGTIGRFPSFDPAQPAPYTFFGPTAPGSFAIVFTGRVVTPQAFAAVDIGKWYVTQLVTTHRSIRANVAHAVIPNAEGDADIPAGGILEADANSYPGTLDTRVEMNGSRFNADSLQYQTHDNPTQPLLGDIDRSSADDQFETWLMYVPPGADSKAIPLKKIETSWGAAMYRVNTPKAWDWDLNHAKYIIGGASVDVSGNNHPVWTLNVKDLTTWILS